MDINIITEQEAATLREMIAASQRIVICCHKSPDGDAVGSSLGWSKYLQALGKKPVVCLPDAMPDFLQWLPGSESTLRYDKQPDNVKQSFEEADLVFCLDFGSKGRTDEMEEVLYLGNAKRVVIDHHLNPDLEADMLISRPHLSSASELVFRLVWQLQAFEQLDQEWAKCVYCGMMTDTGGFTYNSSDPMIYFIISQLLTKGIDKDKIYRKVFNNYSPWSIRFRGYVMSQKLNVFDELHACFYSVTKRELKRFHFMKGDLEGLVNEPLRIKGMKLSISLREDTEKENLVLVSLRSVDDFPCNKVAEKYFNGGGHLNASGGKLHCSIRKAEEIAMMAIQDFMKVY